MNVVVVVVGISLTNGVEKNQCQVSHRAPSHQTHQATKSLCLLPFCIKHWVFFKEQRHTSAAVGIAIVNKRVDPLLLPRQDPLDQLTPGELFPEK